MAFPLVTVSGSPYERGCQHGEALRREIGRNLEVYFARFALEGLKRAEVLRFAEDSLIAIAAQSPAYFAGLQGIAEAAGRSLELIAALNLRYEILYYAYGQSVRADGCTAFAVPPSRSANGHLLIGQTWDWIPEVSGALIQSSDDGPRQTLGFVEAGIFGEKIGLNSAGVGLVINGLSTIADNWRRRGRPFHLRCYDALRAADVPSATAAVSVEPRACAANFLLAQPPGHIVDLEVAPDALHRIASGDTSLVHANHFLAPPSLGIVETASEENSRSCERQARLEELLAQKPRVSAADLQTFLADHAGFPHGICYHIGKDDPPDEQFATVAAFVMDLNARTMSVADGPPCEREFVSVGL
ncbi:MAG TPA: C45 family peptidase [Chloroflexota bacterium]|nr:C45 family peptidase [Chloroflexota bacterium]